MAKIYISSTLEDLKESRQVIYQTLRRMRHDAIAMEDYISTGQKPLSRCLADVAECDLYIGIFAWKYGYVPKEENPGRKSITELEYRKATELSKVCLIFILRETAPWSPLQMDAITGDGEHGTNIAELRLELATEREVNFFETLDQLIGLIALSIYQWEKLSNGSSVSQPQSTIEDKSRQETIPPTVHLPETDEGTSDDLLGLISKYRADIATTRDILIQITNQIKEGSNISLDQLRPIGDFLLKTKQIAEEFSNFMIELFNISSDSIFTSSFDKMLENINKLLKEFIRIISSYIVLYGFSEKKYPQLPELQNNLDMLLRNLQQIDVFLMDALGKLVQWLVGQAKEFTVPSLLLPRVKLVNVDNSQTKEKVLSCKTKLQRIQNSLQVEADIRKINRKDIEIFRKELGEVTLEVRKLVNTSTMDGKDGFYMKQTGSDVALSKQTSTISKSRVSRLLEKDEKAIISSSNYFLLSADLVYEDIKRAMNELALALDILDGLEEKGTMIKNVFGMGMSMRRVFYDCLSKCHDYLHEALQEFLV